MIMASPFQLLVSKRKRTARSEVVDDARLRDFVVICSGVAL
jgi:hypothetical protein